MRPILGLGKSTRFTPVAKTIFLPHFRHCMDQIGRQNLVVASDGPV